MPLKWIPRSKSGASKSRPRWVAHTRIGNVWEYPPPPGLAGVKGTPIPQNIRPTLSPMDNTLILCSYQFLLSKRNQAAVLQRSNLNSHTEIGAMKVYTNTVISTHNIFYCTGLKNECPYLWKVCLSTLCANEIS